LNILTFISVSTYAENKPAGLRSQAGLFCLKR